MLTIRPAGPPDVDVLGQIAAAAYQRYVPRIGRPPAPMTADYALAVRAGDAWVAVQDGQVVGFADTDVYDVDCAAAKTAGFRFQAVIWEPNGSVRQLAPLDGDTVASAFGINSKGQVVGSSGVCANTTPLPYVSSAHAVLWERDGTPIDLGSLGGPVSGATATFSSSR